MKRWICSTSELRREITVGHVSEDTAFISFYNSSDELSPKEEKFIFPDNYECVYYIDIPDVSLDTWGRNGKDDRDYHKDADKLAEFICNAVKHDQLIVCQCSDGRSRSAAAIDQQFEKNRIRVFEMQRYNPNKAI